MTLFDIRGLAHALIMTALLPLVAAQACEAGGFDIGAGAGMNYDGQNVNQGFIYVGHGWDSEKYGFLTYRLEGSLDLIGNGSSLFIWTILPAARLHVVTESAWRPFFDIGAGVSLKHGNLVGHRHLDGPIAFTLMDAIGVEYRSAGGRTYSVSTRFKHISNSGLYKRNQGFNAQYVVLSIGF